MKTWFPIIGIICAIVLILSIIYGIWMLQRKVHYRLSYKSMVEQTVRDMVKPEALKGQ